jgi:hypothetical protein
MRPLATLANTAGFPIMSASHCQAKYDDFGHFPTPLKNGVAAAQRIILAGQKTAHKKHLNPLSPPAFRGAAAASVRILTNDDVQEKGRR